VPNHLFVVDQTLNVATVDQQLCTLSAGNVLRLEGAPEGDAQTASLVVAASRRMDCPSGTEVVLALEDLQNMQDNFRAKLDSGLEALHANQGQGGLPPAPKSAIAAPPRPAVDLPADPANVEAAVSAAQDEATQSETQMMGLAFPRVPPGGY